MVMAISSSPSLQFIPSLSFTSPFSSVPSLVCLFLSLFFNILLLFVRPLYESTSHIYSHTCSQTHAEYFLTIKDKKKHTKMKKLLTSNNKTKMTAHKTTHTFTLPFIALLSVCVSLPSVGGAAALCYTSTITVHFFQTAINLTASVIVRGLLLSATVACSAVCSPTICNPSLPSALFYKVNSRHQSWKERL